MRQSLTPLLLLPALLLGCGKNNPEPPKPATLTFAVVRTLAGSNTPGTATSNPAGYADGTGTAARFDGPEGVAADAQGNVYVADHYNARLRKITPAGVVSTYLGGNAWGYWNGPLASARFNYLTDVAFDRQGNQYVVQFSDDCVRKVTPGGMVSTLAGHNEFYNYGDSIIYYADGLGTAARFHHPSGLAIDGQDNVYVADAGNGCIRKITPAGVVSTLAGTGRQSGFADGPGPAARFRGPVGLAVGPQNELYVADELNHRIRKITPAGVVTTLAGTGQPGFRNGPGATATFRQPTGVAVDAEGNVYVADNGNSCIRQIAPDGTVTTLTGGQSGRADGPLQTAQFMGPYGITLDADGRLIVSDVGAHNIRTISAQ